VTRPSTRLRRPASEKRQGAKSRERRKRAAIPPRFRSSSWPSGCISTGPPERRSRCRATPCTPSGSCCTTIRIFAASSISCARNWTGRPRAGGSVPRLLPSGCRPRTLLIMPPPGRWGPAGCQKPPSRPCAARSKIHSGIFSRASGSHQRGTEGSNPSRNVIKRPGVRPAP
jgi:hypothetical protein